MAASFPVPMVNGTVLMLPLGFKFSPSDEELVVKYLRPRAVDEPLPCALIVDAEIMRNNPWELVPEGAKEKYFFAHRELKYKVGTRVNRAAGEGYWRATGTEVPVYAQAGGHSLLVGMKRSLVFYRGSPPNGERTVWAMQEYRLAGAGLTPCRVMRRTGTTNTYDPPCRCAAAAIAKKNDALAAVLRDAVARTMLDHVMVTPDESWVVCRIYKKKRRARRVVQAANPLGGVGANFIDFLGETNREPSPAASCTGNTSLDKEEECSSMTRKLARKIDRQ